MKVLYLDESGDHRLKKINPNYPVFALGGVIVDRSYVREVIEPRVRKFMLQFFGRADVILHTVDIRNNARDFTRLTDPEFRTDFFAELNAMLAELDYKVIVVVVKKHDFLARHSDNPGDLYMYAFETLVERFCWELGSELDSGFICAEKRGATLDRELMDTWERLQSGGVGTGGASSTQIDERIVGLDLRDKVPNLAGMQIADLVITPAGRHVLQNPVKKDQVQWSAVEIKLRRNYGTYDGYGLIVKP